MLSPIQIYSSAYSYTGDRSPNSQDPKCCGRLLCFFFGLPKKILPSSMWKSIAFNKKKKKKLVLKMENDYNKSNQDSKIGTLI